MLKRESVQKVNHALCLISGNTTFRPYEFTLNLMVLRDARQVRSPMSYSMAVAYRVPRLPYKQNRQLLRTREFSGSQKE